jgi:hypothetical protein
MGLIKFVPSEEVPTASISNSQNGKFTKLYIANWRLLRNIVGEKKLLVVIHNFQMFKIHDITLQEFHDNSKIVSGFIEKPFKYCKNSLSCEICDGAGRVDWIQKVMVRKPSPFFYVTKPYRRDPTKIISLDPLPVHRAENVFGSIPKLPFGFEICSSCKGSGVRSIYTDRMVRCR